MGDLKELTVDIVAAYVETSHISADDLPTLIRTVHQALDDLGKPEDSVAAPSAKATAAQIRKSIQPAFLVSFIDGKPYKTLKRHITTQGMTVLEYLEKYGLPKDYPLVSRETSLKRTAVALAAGFGRKGRGRPAAPVKAAAKKRLPKGP